MIPEQDKYTIQEVAKRYISRGWCVLPLVPKGKKCTIEEWQHLRIKAEEIEEFFDEDSNIGLLLGEASAGLTDVDLDAPEAVTLAKHFFKDTLAAGRGGKRTHLFYKVPEGIKSVEYKDIEKGNILEIRSDRRQTVVYPSIHPSGEQYAWLNTLEPQEVSKIDLRSMAARAATAAILLKYLPNEGEGLHDISLAFVGFMGRNLLDAAEDPEGVIELLWSVLEPVWIAKSASRKAMQDLYRNIEGTINKLAAGDEEITGGPRFKDLLPEHGAAILERITQWWGWILKPSPEERKQRERRRIERRADKAWETCKDLAHEPELLDELYYRVAESGLIREEDNAKLLILMAVSLLRGEAFSAIFKGASAVGKSEVIKAVSKVLPPEMWLDAGSMSETALAYAGENGELVKKILIVFELGGFGKADSQSLEMAKQIMTEGKIVRYITVTSPNSPPKSKRVESEGPTSMWTTTTKVNTDHEFNTRVVELNPDDSQEQTARINEQIFDYDHEPEEEPDYTEEHELFRWLLGQENKVYWKEGFALGKMLPRSSVVMRRESKRLRMLLDAHATLHQKNREIDERGRIIATTADDYEPVRKLVEGFVGASSERGVKQQVRETVEAAIKILDDPNFPQEGVTVSDLKKVLNKDNSTASRRIKDAHPYLKELDTKRQRSKQYGRGDPLPEETPIMPTADEICNFARNLRGAGLMLYGGLLGCKFPCKTRANLAQATRDSRVSQEEKPLTNKGFLTQTAAAEHESPDSENPTQNCKLQDEDPQQGEVSTQICTSFASEAAHEAYELATQFSGPFHPDEWETRALSAGMSLDDFRRAKLLLERAGVVDFVMGSRYEESYYVLAGRLVEAS